MIDFFNSGIIKDLKSTFQECFVSFENQGNYEPYIVGTTAFSMPTSKDYGNSYFDYGMGVKINMTDIRGLKPKRISMESDIQEWKDSNISEHCKKYGIKWLYEITNKESDKTAFVYDAFDIDYLKAVVFMEVQRVFGNKHLIINQENIEIQDEKVIYSNKKD